MLCAFFEHHPAAPGGDLVASFDAFANVHLPALVATRNPMVMADGTKVFVVGIRYQRPLLTPGEAVAQTKTYEATLVARLEIHREGNPGVVVLEDVQLASVPVMVGSELLCQNERVGGLVGTFIVDGRRAFVASKEVLVAEEEGVKLVLPSISNHHTSGFRGIAVEMTHRDKLFVVPLFLVFRALGVVSDREILSHITFSSTDPLEEMADCLYDTILSTACAGAFNRSAAAQFLAKHMGLENDSSSSPEDEALKIVRANVFPDENAGDDDVRAIRLGELVYRRVVLGGRKARGQTRILRCGDGQRSPLVEWFSAIWADDVHRRLERVVLHGEAPFVLCGGGYSGYSAKIAGMQLLTAASYRYYVSKITTMDVLPSTEDGDVKSAARLDPARFGMVCPISGCHLAATCVITAAATPDILDVLVREVNREDACLFVPVAEIVVMPSGSGSGGELDYRVLVYVDGKWAGYTPSADAFVSRLKTFRRSGELVHPMTSIAWDVTQSRIDISTGGGRMCRPLMTASACDGDEIATEPLSWAALLRAGAVEYVDEAEQSTSCLIGKTHREIHPAAVLSLVNIATHPFAQHMFAPAATHLLRSRWDVVGVLPGGGPEPYELQYPQHALVGSHGLIRRVLPALDALPDGQNPVVAVLSCGGHNQWQSIVVNKSAVERGMFATSKPAMDRSVSLGEGARILVGRSSSAASKVALVLSTEDMPYCAATGLVPDIVVNPHDVTDIFGVPFCVELCLATSACFGNRARRLGNCLPFDGAQRELEPSEYLFHDPRSGNQLSCRVLMGPVHAQILVPTPPQSSELPTAELARRALRFGMASVALESGDGRNCAARLRRDLLALSIDQTSFFDTDGCDEVDDVEVSYENGEHDPKIDIPASHYVDADECCESENLVDKDKYHQSRRSPQREHDVVLDEDESEDEAGGEA